MVLDVNGKTKAEAALIYARAGIPVFALHSPGKSGCSCGKPKCKNIGKHPRTPNGVKDATTDQGIIKAMWEKWPTANIGIACGQEAGICVVDVDPIHGGNESIALLEEKYGKLPETSQSRTGSGGQHIFFKYPGDSFKNCNRGEIGEGIDFKNDGGYVVAAPSLHASGKQYEWLSNDLGNIADLPDYIKEKVAKRRPSQAVKSQPVGINEGKIPDGQRNSTLFSSACSMRHRGLAPESIKSALMSENMLRCNPPLEDTEVDNIVESACKYEPNGSKARSFNLTDVGNAQRLVERHAGEFRYCNAWKKFLVWQKKRYVVDDTGCIERMAKETVRNILNEAALVEDDPARKKIVKHAMASENQQRLKSMIILAQSEEGVPVTPAELDKDDWFLNCLNGTINLKTGECREHRQGDLITKLVPVKFDPSAECQTWIAFLEKIMGGKEDMIIFLQKAVGYSLTANTQEQCMFILHGTGANGKSTFLNTIEALFADYAQQTPTETLMAKKNEGIRNDIARLQGTRFVTASEADQGKSFAESLIKQMTGGDKLTARFLHGEFFEFIPKFKLFLATNHRPNIRGTDNGIWRRLRLIPFDVTIPKEEQDQSLMDKLKAEMPGILNWAIRGCLLWQQTGLTPPREVSAATNEYRQDLDWLNAFISDRLVERSGLKISASDLYHEYKDWAAANGEHEYNQRVLGTRLKDKGYQSKRSGRTGTTEWLGLGKCPESIDEFFATERTEPAEAT